MSDKRKNIKTAIPIGNVIEKILTGRKPKAAAKVARVFQLWERAVGEIIAANAKPAAFKDNILLVHVNSSPWLHHLQFLKKDIIQKVNAALKDESIEDIKFKIGPIK
jgi:predicted nucleic acid-binding Zn ribbon protein